jgi:4-aminobutyrate aminotransferase-like enzyme
VAVATGIAEYAEPIPAEGGIIVPRREYFSEVMEILNR